MHSKMSIQNDYNGTQCITASDILLLNGLCTNVDEIDITEKECVKDLNFTEEVLRYITGSWYIFIAVLGTIGNLATLISIPMAARRKMFGFDENVETTIFILNLSFIDLSYCIFYALPQSSSYIMNYWFMTLPICQACYLIGNTLSCSGKVGVALISMSRCLEITKNNVWAKISEKKCMLFLTIALSWVYSLIGLGIEIKFGNSINIGWNCELGLCAPIPKVTESPFYIVTFVISAITIMTCYFIMWYKVRQSAKYLKYIGTLFPKQLQDRQNQLTRTILFLILADVLCNLPELFLIPFSAPNYIVCLSCIINKFQFVINFFIYALSNAQYRKAYLHFWRRSKCQEDLNILIREYSSKLSKSQRIRKQYSSKFTKSKD